MKNIFTFIAFLVLTTTNLFSSHIVGGNVSVQQTGNNQFLVTLRVFKDCDNGLLDPDPTDVEIFDAVTGAFIQTIDFTPEISSTVLSLGDACFSPNICVEEFLFRKTITLADNPNGYIIAWGTCCRNSASDNISSPSSAGFTLYAQIPNPAIQGQNSSPVFGQYPQEGYFCSQELRCYPTSVYDPDGDSLKFSFTVPFDQYTTTGSSIDMPIDVVSWAPGYGLNNALGPGSTFTINPVTGEICANALISGTFVFSVKVEEFRNGVKIGEVVRDVQFTTFNCNTDILPVLAPTATLNQVIFEGQTCIDFVAVDPDITDTVRFVLSSPNTVKFGAQFLLPTPINTNTTPFTYQFEYTDTTNGNNVQSQIQVSQINDSTFEGVGDVGARFCWSPDVCDILGGDSVFELKIEAFSLGCDGPDTLRKSYSVELEVPPTSGSVPNIFTPNNDKKNDFFHLTGEYNRCYDNIHVEIFNRWGELVFTSDDPLFMWDGTDLSGKELSDGTYFVLLEGIFGKSNVTSQFPVTLRR